MDTNFITINTHSSIRVDAGDEAIVYIDPFKLETEPHDADLILITHEHFDHFSPDDIARVAKDGTLFVAPEGMEGDFAKAGIASSQVTFVSPGSVCAPLEGVRVKAVPAYNKLKPFHPRRNGWVGYVLVTTYDTRIYIAGDTDDLPENHEIRCDIACVPVGGKYTMNAREAAAFVNALHPRFAIPEHYGTVAGSTDDGKRFAELVDPDIEVVFKL